MHECVLHGGMGIKTFSRGWGRRIRLFIPLYIPQYEKKGVLVAVIIVWQRLAIVDSGQLTIRLASADMSNKAFVSGLTT